MSFKIEPYTITSLLAFRRNQEIELNPKFQRRGVWSASMQSYLIDSILREMSIPKIYFRTKINTSTLTASMDVVDGQQRLRAIFAFADNKLRLNSKAGADFRGKRFSELDEVHKEIFLRYTISTEHILDASDDYAVQVFSRLNQTGIKLNHAETRNAEFDGDFKWAVVQLASELTPFFFKHNILSIKEQIRMIDHELTAELMMLCIQGVVAGTASQIKKTYTQLDKGFNGENLSQKIKDIVTDFDEHLANVLEEAFASRTHFAMLFLAAYFSKYREPVSISQFENKRSTYPENQDEWSVVASRISHLNAIITNSFEPRDSEEVKFRDASQAATINEKSRKDRMPFYLNVFGNYEED